MFEPVAWIKRCPIFDAEAIVFTVILDMEMGRGVFVGTDGHSQAPDTTHDFFVETAKFLPLIQNNWTLIQTRL